MQSADPKQSAAEAMSATLHALQRLQGLQVKDQKAPLGLQKPEILPWFYHDLPLFIVVDLPS